MDFGTALALVQTVFAVLSSPQFIKICSMIDRRYKSDMESLKNTIATVMAVFRDAEATKHGLSHQTLLWLEELKDAVYDADDLLDEFVTRAERKKLMEGGTLSKKVHDLISRIKSLAIAPSMSQRVREIRERLDEIARNHNDFGFKLDNQPIISRSEETCSYVKETDIIGRDEDREWIIGRLLESDVGQHVPILSIVGMGGLGKTALGQLVYNDSRIVEKFPLRLWVCVSDQDQKYFDVKHVLCQIIESASTEKSYDSSLDHVQRKLRKQLNGKKFLLVLDDLWNEDPLKWNELAKYLNVGGRGSWVIVTTRSKEAGRIVGNKPMYELQGLTEENSWRLFKNIAFKEEQPRAGELVPIGKNIVKKCCNVPLAIKVAGSLLYGQEKDRWLSFQEMKLAEMSLNGKGILPILKLSYNHLDSPLKSCFSYCAIFPKDFRMKKTLLCRLWMAQGYIFPMREGQSLEDASEDYFSILSRRCFFQDIEVDYHGVIVCKMHDLMHDIAQEVAGREISATVGNSPAFNLDERTRHVYDFKFLEGEVASKIRTYFPRSTFKSDTLEPFVGLRALSLYASRIKCLPKDIGNLLHLRYLDLTFNDNLKVLPKSVTKLYNLQTLILFGCYSLTELPQGFGKLVNLRILENGSCSSLASMPLGMGNLSSLHTLPSFILGEPNLSSKIYLVDQLRDLKALVNLKGYLNLSIQVSENAVYIKEPGGGEHLKGKQHLRHIIYKLSPNCYSEALMEELQPHPNVTQLNLQFYCGLRMPSWMREDNLEASLPNLCILCFNECNGLRFMSSSLGKLPHLKSLTFQGMRNLEYVEAETSRGTDSASSSSNAIESLFFPSLIELKLVCLPRLKGWWSGVGMGDEGEYLLPFFPYLSKLVIESCPNLVCIPLCPTINKLYLYEFNERLVLDKKSKDHEKGQATSLNSSSSRKDPVNSSVPNLTSARTDSIVSLKSLLPVDDLVRVKDMNVRSVGDTGNVFWSCLSWLRKLKIHHCHQLKTLSGCLDHLTCLESLKLIELLVIDLDNCDEPWRSLESLRELRLSNLPKLVNLPNGMQYLTALQSLSIVSCDNLEALPDWIGCLSSLQSLEISACKKIESLPKTLRELTSLAQLEIYNCSVGLKKRCQKPNGQDWAHIQHIPDVKISLGYKSTLNRLRERDVEYS